MRYSKNSFPFFTLFRIWIANTFFRSPISYKLVLIFNTILTVAVSIYLYYIGYFYGLDISTPPYLTHLYFFDQSFSFFTNFFLQAIYSILNIDYFNLYQPTQNFVCFLFSLQSIVLFSDFIYIPFNFAALTLKEFALIFWDPFNNINTFSYKYYNQGILPFPQFRQKQGDSYEYDTWLRYDLKRTHYFIILLYLPLFLFQLFMYPISILVIKISIFSYTAPVWIFLNLTYLFYTFLALVSLLSCYFQDVLAAGPFLSYKSYLFLNSYFAILNGFIDRLVCYLNKWTLFIQFGIWQGFWLGFILVTLFILFAIGLFSMSFFVVITRILIGFIRTLLKNFIKFFFKFEGLPLALYLLNQSISGSLYLRFFHHIFTFPTRRFGLSYFRRLLSFFFFDILYYRMIVVYIYSRFTSVWTFSIDISRVFIDAFADFEFISRTDDDDRDIADDMEDAAHSLDIYETMDIADWFSALTGESTEEDEDEVELNKDW